jgi:hypothetical protein
VLSEPKYSARSEEEVSCALLAGVGQFQCRSFIRKNSKERGGIFSYFVGNVNGYRVSSRFPGWWTAEFRSEFQIHCGMESGITNYEFVMCHCSGVGGAGTKNERAIVMETMVWSCAR